jgi:hypothetical protein
LNHFELLQDKIGLPAAGPGRCNRRPTAGAANKQHGNSRADVLDYQHPPNLTCSRKALQRSVAGWFAAVQTKTIRLMSY